MGDTSFPKKASLHCNRCCQLELLDGCRLSRWWGESFLEHLLPLCLSAHQSLDHILLLAVWTQFVWPSNLRAWFGGSYIMALVETQISHSFWHCGAHREMLFFLLKCHSKAARMSFYMKFYYCFLLQWLPQEGPGWFNCGGSERTETPSTLWHQAVSWGISSLWQGGLWLFG